MQGIIVWINTIWLERILAPHVEILASITLYRPADFVILYLL